MWSPNHSQTGFVCAEWIRWFHLLPATLSTFMFTIFVFYFVINIFDSVATIERYNILMIYHQSDHKEITSVNRHGMAQSCATTVRLLRLLEPSKRVGSGWTDRWTWLWSTTGSASSPSGRSGSATRVSRRRARSSGCRAAPWRSRRLFTHSVKHTHTRFAMEAGGGSRLQLDKYYCLCKVAESQALLRVPGFCPQKKSFFKISTFIIQERFLHPLDFSPLIPIICLFSDWEKYRKRNVIGQSNSFFVKRSHFVTVWGFLLVKGAKPAVYKMNELWFIRCHIQDRNRK